jgi:hypothetical protein
MNVEKQAPSEIMMDTVVEKVENQQQRIQTQEEKLALVEKKVNTIPDHSKDIGEMKTSFRDLLAVSKGQNALMVKLDVFFSNLKTATDILEHPVESKVQHHHHIPKIIWIAAGLFLVLCLVCTGWYMTARDSGQYQANDIKYRQLKLDAGPAFHQYLVQLDSIYLADPDKMRKNVIELERLKQKRLELIDQLQTVNSKIGPDIKTGQKKGKGK